MNTGNNMCGSRRGHRAARVLMGGLLMSIGITQTGCRSAQPSITAPTASYRQALTETAPTTPPALAPGSDAERRALDRFAAFFGDFSESNVTALVREVYAPDAYLRDGFKELRGVDAIAPYMIRSTEPLRLCVFTFEDIAAKNGDYYIRWVMRANLRRDPPERVSEVIGLSQVRFNAQGQVTFQQDYWDPSDVLYSRIPIAGWMINKVKASL